MNNSVTDSELYRVLASLHSEEEIRILFEDLCTYKEIEQMSQRLIAAEMLMQGMTYTQVTSKTDISTATLSRVSRCIQHGSGGYSSVLRRCMAVKEDGSND